MAWPAQGPGTGGPYIQGRRLLSWTSGVAADSQRTPHQVGYRGAAGGLRWLQRGPRRSMRCSRPGAAWRSVASQFWAVEPGLADLGECQVDGDHPRQDRKESGRQHGEAEEGHEPADEGGVPLRWAFQQL